MPNVRATKLEIDVFACWIKFILCILFFRNPIGVNDYSINRLIDCHLSIISPKATQTRKHLASRLSSHKHHQSDRVFNEKKEYVCARIVRW